MKLMLKKLEIDKLEIDKKKVPSPTCEQIIDLLLGTWKEASVDFNAVFKRLFVTDVFDGSESSLVFDKLFSLI